MHQAAHPPVGKLWAQVRHYQLHATTADTAAFCAQRAVHPQAAWQVAGGARGQARRNAPWHRIE